MQVETAQWSLGAVTNILASSNSTCPSGYDQVTASFYGTQNICVRPSNLYTLG
jgi:hypothetical protein